MIRRIEKALIEIGSKAEPALTKLLADQDGDVRNHAAKALAEIGPEAVPDLIQHLGYVANKAGYNAAMALGKIGPEAKDAIPGLIQLLEDI